MLKKNKNAKYFILLICLIIGIVGTIIFIQSKNNKSDKYSIKVIPQNESTAKTDGNIPSYFPKDFPIYPNSTITSSSQSGKSVGTIQQNEFHIQANSKATVLEIKDFYTQELAKKGWADITTSVLIGNEPMIKTKKGYYSFEITIFDITDSRNIFISGVEE